MVWAASALGIAIGAGFYIQATVAMVLIILAINVLPHLVKIAGPYSLRQKDLSIKITVNEHRELDGIFKQIKNLNMQVKRVKIKDIDNGASQQLEMVILAPEDLYTTELYSSLKEIDHVVSVEVENNKKRLKRVMKIHSFFIWEKTFCYNHLQKGMQMMEIHIRRATKDDIAGIVKVHVESWKTTYKGIFANEILENVTFEQRKKQWENIFQKEDNYNIDL